MNSRPNTMGLTKLATILTRMAKNPHLSKVLIRDPRVFDEVSKHLSALRKGSPEVGARLAANPNTTVGDFMRVYHPFMKGEAVKADPVPKARGLHGVHPRFFEYLPPDVRYGKAPLPSSKQEYLRMITNDDGPIIRGPLYEDFRRQFGREQADKYTAEALRRARDRGYGELLNEMGRRGMSPIQQHDMLTTGSYTFRPTDHRDPSLLFRSFLSKRRKFGMRRTPLGRSGQSLYSNRTTGNIHPWDEFVRVDPGGEVDVLHGFTKRQRRRLSRQLRGMVKSRFGEVPAPKGVEPRFYIDQFPMHQSELREFNASFQPANGPGRSGNSQSMMRVTEPVDYDRMRARYVGPNGRIRKPRPEVSVPIIRGSDGRYYVRPNTLFHEAGHAQSYGEGLPGKYSYLDASNPFLRMPSKDLPLNLQRTMAENRARIREELSANFRGGVGDPVTGETPSLTTYLLDLAKTPEQVRYAQEVARRMGTYVDNPWARFR